MTESEKQMWLTNITELADRITGAMGYETVRFVYGNYGAESLDDLDSGMYHAVFADLATIEENMG